jgi:hypothetical protein
LAQTTASNLEAVIEPAAVLAVVVALGVRAELAELAAQGVREALVALAVQVVPAVQVAPVARVVPAVRAALVDLAVQVVPANPAVRAVPEDPVALAVPELETGRVAELELVPVAAEREPDQVAVRLRIKSVTEPHRHGQVRVPKRVEDLAAAAAETTHAPAVTEVATAWGAAE